MTSGYYHGARRECDGVGGARNSYLGLVSNPMWGVIICDRTMIMYAGTTPNFNLTVGLHEQHHGNYSISEMEP